MQVQFNPTPNYNIYNKYDINSPAFKMNMKELKGVDQFVAKNYDINPQKFKTFEKFYIYCKELTANLYDHYLKNFPGRRQETRILRQAMLKEWYDYITKENDNITGATALMILKGITSKLEKNDDTLPPVLNKGVLADTMSTVQSTLEKEPKKPLNFGKEYCINLQKSLMAEEKKLDESLSGWIVIPSKKHDPENFEANVDKLKMLSHNNWCTKSYNAEPYLAKGDFHVYMEKGKPKLGVRFDKNQIAEIQGEQNNSTIPLSYSDIALAHVKEYRLSSQAKEEINEVKKIKEIIRRFPNGIGNASTQEILKTFGIKCKKDKDGLLIISEYRQPCHGYKYCDFGIDETRLFKDIKIIKENADLQQSETKDLGNLQVIGKDVILGIDSPLKEHAMKCVLRNKFPKGIENYSTQEILETLGIKCKKDKDGLLILSGYDQPGNYTFGDLGIDENKLLKDIKEIKGYANFISSNATDIGSLQTIDGEVYFRTNDCILKKLWTQHILSQKFPKGVENYSTQEILEAFGIKCKKDKDGLLIISEYRHPYSDYSFNDFGIDEDKLLKDVKIIERDADLNYSQAKSLGNVQHIGGYLSLAYSQVESLNKLQHVRKDVYLGSAVNDLGELKYIGGELNCNDSKITSLGNVEKIGRSLVLSKESTLTSSGKLKKINGDVYLNNFSASVDGFLSKVRVRGKVYVED